MAKVWFGEIVSFLEVSLRHLSCLISVTKSVISKRKTFTEQDDTLSVLTA
jgi:hypothetical protein